MAQRPWIFGPGGATVVEIGGHAGNDAQIRRHDGFRQGIAGSNIVIIDSQNAENWITANAMAIAEDFIVRHGDDIKGVFVHWDNGATGVINAMHNAGMDDVFIVGVDGNRAGFEQVRNGTQSVSVGQSFTNMARQSLANAQTMLEGGTVPEINFIPLDVITLQTIDTFPAPEW